jgi:hypothetical protein
MTPSQLHRAALEMQSGRHGQFCALIADAYLIADPTNREKLIAAFGDLFARVHQFNHRLEIVTYE